MSLLYIKYFLLKRLWCYPSIFKLRAYLTAVHRRDAYKDKKKTIYDVKYIYLFFKVNKCFDLVSYGGVVRAVDW